MNKNEWIDNPLMVAFAREGTDAHRLCTTNGGWVERFDQDILISFQTEIERESLTKGLLEWAKSAGFAFRRVFGRLLPRRNEKRASPRLVLGDADEDRRSIATERNLRFAIDFGAGYSAGLFLDQRENRSRVRTLGPKRLLNCFAYTCSFSVAAAATGAQTVNVDLSRKWLARGRENFGLNSLSINEHRFIDDDVRPVLRRLAGRGETFDTIILDPPTFSRSSRGGTFRIERDFEDLLLAALNVATENAQILLSTNCATLDVSALEKLARSCLRLVKRTGTFHRTPRLSDFPPGAGASSVWLSLR